MALDLRPPRPTFGFVACTVTKQGGAPFTADIALVAPGTGAQIQADAEVLDWLRFTIWAADAPWVANGVLANGDVFGFYNQTYSVVRIDDSDPDMPQYACLKR